MQEPFDIKRYKEQVDALFAEELDCSECQELRADEDCLPPRTCPYHRGERYRLAFPSLLEL